jgi:hypothetical protein
MIDEHNENEDQMIEEPNEQIGSAFLCLTLNMTPVPIGMAFNLVTNSMPQTMVNFKENKSFSTKRIC